MRGSHDKQTPRQLTEWLARESPDWQPAFPFPKDIREPVVDALRKAQRGLCVYCGRRLPADQAWPERYHFEHFRPRSRYPHLATDLANLFLSCSREAGSRRVSATCGHAKGDRFDETNCIEPEYPACTRRFRFLLTGKAVPRTEDDAAAETMIEILNMNHRELVKDREDILESVDGDGLELSDFVDPVSGEVQSYAHVVCEHLGEVIP